MNEEVHEIWVSRQPTVAVRFSCRPEEVGARLGPALQEVGRYLHETKSEGDAEGVYTRFLGLGQDYDIEAGYTLHEDLPGGGRVRASELPDCEAAIVRHGGPYRGVAEATDSIRAWMAANGREPGGAPWAVYMRDAESEHEEVRPEGTTEIYWPLKPKMR